MFFADLITSLGRPAEVAAAMGVDAQLPSAWRRRNSVPTAYWPRLIEIARLKGIELDTDKLLAARIGLRMPNPTALEDGGA